ncbi:hypothetical protein [Acidisoma sp. L85]|uniref:hypothetical protein n=1 Tax=Acidisoma sp. L85 TaxID=1641850 RepID=UPI00131BF0FA|nr:hypothetical protein [Acidisoma sp. L85]
MDAKKLRMELAELEWSLEQWTTGNLTTIETGKKITRSTVAVWRHRIRDIKRELASNSYGSARPSL